MLFTDLVLKAAYSVSDSEKKTSSVFILGFFFLLCHTGAIPVLKTIPDLLQMETNALRRMFQQSNCFQFCILGTVHRSMVEPHVLHSEGL